MSGKLSQKQISQVYAKALLGLGSNDKAQEQFLSEIALMTSSMEQCSDLGKIFGSAVFSPQEKAKVLQDILKVFSFSKEVAAFLLYMAKEDRIGFLSLVEKEYAQELRVLRNQAIAEIRTPIELDSALKNKIKESLSKTLGREIIVEQKIDADLIAGIVVNVEGRTFDSSLRSQFQSMMKQLDSLS